MFFTSNTHQVKTIPKTSEDEVVNDLNEVKIGRRLGMNRQAKVRSDHAEMPSESESCRRQVINCSVTG